MFGMGNKTLSCLLIAAASIVSVEAYETSRATGRLGRRRASRKLSSGCKYKNGSPSAGASSKYKNGSAMDKTGSMMMKSGSSSYKSGTKSSLDTVECDPADPTSPGPDPTSPGPDPGTGPDPEPNPGVPGNPPAPDTMAPSAVPSSEPSSAPVKSPVPDPIQVIDGGCPIGTFYKTLYTNMDDATLFEHALEGLYSADCIARCAIIGPIESNSVCPFSVFAATPTSDNGKRGWPREVGNGGSSGCAWDDVFAFIACPYSSEPSHEMTPADGICSGEPREAALLQLRDAIAKDACGFCSSLTDEEREANLIGQVIAAP